MNKELNWFERHINWTVIILAIVNRIIHNVLTMMGIIIFPIYIGNMCIMTTSYIVGYAIAFWAIWRKKRSYWWVIIPFLVLFLKNKRIIETE
jgi:hypothetical protein